VARDSRREGGLIVYSTDFDYYRARTLAEAQGLLASHPGAKVLAGGHSLIPLLKLRLTAPPAVIDIGRVSELRGIVRDGDAIRIGALTTHAELAASSELRQSAPALAEAAALVGDPAVRNRGTIGGNIAHADPASDLPAVLVALDAKIVAMGPGGERSVKAREFFTGLMTCALRDDEILAAVVVLGQGAGESSAYVKFPHPASRYAVIGVAAAVGRDQGTCRTARVALGGLVVSARRSPTVEQAIIGTAGDAAAVSAAAGVVAHDLGHDVIGDIFASAEYRSAVAPVYVRRALTEAFARIGTA
jgi:aerobic carbon-monoxide dehydrogenase medium subunit